MHLHDKLCTRKLFFQSFDNTVHSDLDNICCRTLNRCIHCGSVTEILDIAVLALEFVQYPLPAIHRYRIALLFTGIPEHLQIRRNARKLVVIFFNEFSCFLVTDAEIRCKTIIGNTIDDTEVDCLGCRPHLMCDHIFSYTVDLGSSPFVDIPTFVKCRTHDFISAQCGKKS